MASAPFYKIVLKTSPKFHETCRCCPSLSNLSMILLNVHSEISHHVRAKLTHGYFINRSNNGSRLTSLMVTTITSATRNGRAPYQHSFTDLTYRLIPRMCKNILLLGTPTRRTGPPTTSTDADEAESTLGTGTSPRSTAVSANRNNGNLRLERLGLRGD